MKVNESFSPARPDMSDEMLMSCLRTGQEQALFIIHERYRDLLKSVIISVINNENEAQDVLQEVLIQIWRRSDHYSIEKGRFAGWAITMARRRAIDFLRKRHAYHIATEKLKDLKASAPNQQAAQPDVERKDMRNYIDTLLSDLPDAQRHVVELAHLRGMSQRQIARAINQPLGTVKTRLELGMNKLRHATTGSKPKVL